MVEWPVLVHKAGFEEMLKLLKSRKGAISSEQVFFKRRAAFFVQDLKRLLVAKSGTPYLMPLLERMHYQNEVAQMMPPQTESAIAALDEVSKTYVVSGKDPAKEMHWMAAQALLTGARVSGMHCLDFCFLDVLAVLAVFKKAAFLVRVLQILVFAVAAPFATIRCR